MIKRREDWPTRLVNFIAKAQRLSFSWGEKNGGHDCGLFAANAIEEMTGRDPASWFRGRYSTKIGAYRALKKFSGGGIEEAACRISDENNFPEIPVLTAQRGDLVLLCTREGHALGICVGAHIACARPGFGLTYISLSHAERAWRVP